MSDTNSHPVTHQLPFGIEIVSCAGSARLVRSELEEQLINPSCRTSREIERAKAFIDGVESLLVSLAAAGIEISGVAVKEAVTTTVETAADQL